MPGASVKVCRGLRLAALNPVSSTSFAMGCGKCGLPRLDTPHRQTEFKPIETDGVFPHQDHRLGIRHRDYERSSWSRRCRYTLKLPPIAVGELQLDAFDVEQARPCSRAHAQYLRLFPRPIGQSCAGPAATWWS